MKNRRFFIFLFMCAKMRSGDFAKNGLSGKQVFNRRR